MKASMNEESLHQQATFHLSVVDSILPTNIRALGNHPAVVREM